MACLGTALFLFSMPVLYYRFIHNSITHFIKWYTWMAEGTVTYNLQMERETLFFIILLFSMPHKCSMCPPLWHSRRQTDNPFPPIPTVEDQARLRWPPRSPDLTPCYFVWWGMLRFFYCLSHGTCLSCKDKPFLPFQKSVVTCCSGYGWKWITGLTSATLQRADIYGT